MEARELLKLLVETCESGKVTPTYDQKRLLKDWQLCRTVAKGSRVYWCDSCESWVVEYNPCGKRGCPICSKGSQLRWEKTTKKKLLRTGHTHLTFSFPIAVTEQWLKEERQSVKELTAAVNKVFRKLEKRLGLRLGRIMVFQSHAKGLSFKPHIHCLITDGGLDKDGKWKSAGELPLAVMTEWLKEALGKYQEDKGWNIYVSRHLKGGDAVVKYLAGRRMGVVTDIRGLTVEEETVKTSDRDSSVSLDKVTFVERYLKHIPAKGMVTARHYGLYANRQKEQYQKAQSELPSPNSETKEEPEQVPYKEVCPHCRRELHLFANYAAGTRVDFSNFEYEHGVGPPKHKEMSNRKGA